MDAMLPILVVDDNAVNRMALAALLKPLGVPFVLVEGGQQAVAACEHSELSLVLMDLMMPGMDGFEASRRIRASEFGRGRHTPIVAITALDIDTVRERCLAAGIEDVVAKPIDRATIAACIERWTQREVPQGVGDPADVARLVDTFLAVTHALLAEIDAAISAHDEPRIHHAVHELKGAALQMKALEMARLCSDLEAAAHKDDVHEMLAVYGALAHAFARVKSTEPKVKALAARV